MSLKEPNYNNPGKERNVNSKESEKKKLEASDKEMNSVGYIGLLIMVAAACLIGMGIYFLQSL